MQCHPEKSHDAGLKFLKNFAEVNSALTRLPTGRDVAQLCFFLAEADSNSITGQCINIDCGVFPQ